MERERRESNEIREYRICLFYPPRAQSKSYAITKQHHHRATPPQGYTITKQHHREATPSRSYTITNLSHHRTTPSQNTLAPFALAT